jgi:hypothetical protein
MELRKIKHFNELSQETAAFSAQLWVGGKHIADVSNNGEGGPNNIYPAKGYTWKDVQIYNSLDVECEIFSLLADDLIRKDNQSKGLVLKMGDKYELVKFKVSINQLKKLPNYKAMITPHVKTYTDKGYKVLNTNLGI